MKLTSKIVKTAWDRRRRAAKKHNCKVMEISWSECLKFAITCAKAVQKQNKMLEKIKKETKTPTWIKDEGGSYYMPVYC